MANRIAIFGTSVSVKKTPKRKADTENKENTPRVLRSRGI